jgi:hypothetical protein
MTSEEMVRAVFSRVRACDPAVSELYALDATLTSPDGRHEGRGAIAAFYEERFRMGRVEPHIEALFVNLPTVVALLRVSMSEGESIRVVDVFEVGEEGIRSLHICRQAPDDPDR